MFATSALHGRAGPVTFANRGKSNQKRLPLHPASSSGARNGRDVSTAHESSADATHSVRRRHVYDRPLLRSSARAEGAFKQMLDRFAMRTTKTRMRASGLRLLFVFSHLDTESVTQSLKRFFMAEFEVRRDDYSRSRKHTNHYVTSQNCIVRSTFGNLY